MHECLDIRECLRMAVCADAANRQEATCADGLKPLAECLRLGETPGFRAI